MPWQSEAEASACIGCKKAFKLLERKTHCRHCGLVFCTQCTSKIFTLAPPIGSSNPTPIKDKVCDGCFNSMSTLVEKTGDALKQLSKEKEQKQTYDEMFF